MKPKPISQEPVDWAASASDSTGAAAPSVARPGTSPLVQEPTTAAAPRNRVAAETTPTIQGAESVRAAVARIRAICRVRARSGGSGAYSASMSGPIRRARRAVRTTR